MMKNSIKFQISSALAIQFVVLLVIVSVTVYFLNQRKHDYAILNLAGQLRVLNQTIVAQSYHYVERAPRSYASYERDLGLYNMDLKSFIESYDRIITSFKARQLAPDLWSQSALFIYADRKIPSLVDSTETITCTWDKPSRNQLLATDEVWRKFRAELMQELGPDLSEPRLEAAAKYVLLNGPELLEASTRLSSSFRSMMESKLNNINLLNRVAMLFSLFMVITLVYLLYRRTFRPLNDTVRAFERISKGDLTQQVSVSGGSEISSMIVAFNSMARRLAALFHLTDKINQATNLDDTLKFVFEEFSNILPINWVGLLRISPEQHYVILERQYSDKTSALHEKDSFSLPQSFYSDIRQSARPLVIDSLEINIDNQQDNDLLRAMYENSFDSAILFPLNIHSDDKAVLVFAAEQANQYDEEHIELLENIAAQVAHAFDKTIGMESLVISAIEGLAKLAENRDPETGDHLVRMSLYSLILVEQLNEDSTYKDVINPAYIRDVYRFAPMHDIGKVGVPDHVLLKPGKLDRQERSQMEIHPVTGAEVLRRCEQQVQLSGHSIFKVGIEIAEAHHEKFDGTGYPYQLHGEDIPLSARIVAAADVFDALTSRRPYKQAWEVDEAMRYMQEQAGKHFDPVVINAMQQAMPRILDVYSRYRHV